MINSIFTPRACSDVNAGIRPLVRKRATRNAPPLPEARSARDKELKMALNEAEYDELGSKADLRRERGAGLWPFWTHIYAEGDPLPDLSCKIDRPEYTFDEGDD